MTYIIVHATVPTKEDGRRIVRAAIEKRFAACGHVHPAHESFYWWDGKVQNKDEVTITLNTREDLFEEARRLIVDLHPYDCPAIYAVPVLQAHRPYLKYIEIETDELSRSGE
jgi:periplasmic divalent cation tolerance protein